jgi:hypothetical protein
MEKEIETLYLAKLASGKYNHYTEEQKKLLYLDCVKQVQAMHIFNGEKG